MKYWLNVGFLPTADLVEIARAAEELGFEGVAVPDHLCFPSQIESPYPYSASGEVVWPADAPWPDCWVAIAAMAVATRRLRFTTSVYVAPLRDVLTVAKGVATAAGFGQGRVACGFGAGWLEEEFVAAGQNFTARGQRFDEMLAAMRLLWTGEVVEFASEQVRFGPVQMRPVPGDMAVMIGGNTPPALRRAAAHDGWIGSHTGIDDTARMIVDLAAKRAATGRSDHAFEILLSATPRAVRDGAHLADLGVDGMILPAVALATSADVRDVVAGMEQLAERRFA